MVIALAQIASLPGDLLKNREKHLHVAERASLLGAEAVVFPELSLSGYEPALAEGLALSATDDLLHPFQQFSADRNLLIAIGAPLQTGGGIHIGMVVFLPDGSRVAYAKQMLHPDEDPFFVPGTAPVVIQVHGERIVPAICYESLQPAHAAEAASLGATIYLASAAKSAAGMAKAQVHYPLIARKHAMNVLLANSVGPSDNFVGAGGSGAWASSGEPVASLGATNECLLLVDTSLKTASAPGFI